MLAALARSSSALYLAAYEEPLGNLVEQIMVYQVHPQILTGKRHVMSLQVLFF